MSIFEVQNFMLNQYLGSVNYNMDKYSTFGVHKSEEGKNRGIWCDSLVTHPVTKSCLVNDTTFERSLLLRSKFLSSIASKLSSRVAE